MGHSSDFRSHAEQIIQTYYEACNHGDADRIRSCFAADAVHYFPAGAPQGPFRGAEAIAAGWRSAVDTLGSSWVAERLAVDDVGRIAVLEWTHYKPKHNSYLRGDEWFEFDAGGSIREIRAYYAAPPGTTGISHELGDFPYSTRGYSTRLLDQGSSS